MIQGRGLGKRSTTFGDFSRDVYEGLPELFVESSASGAFVGGEHVFARVAHVVDWEVVVWGGHAGA